jgi:hypothetical protein
MAYEFPFAIGGALLLAAGIWRFEGLHRASAALLCVFGLVLIAMAAPGNGSGWVPRRSAEGVKPYPARS